MAKLRRILSGYPFYIEHAGFLEELYRRNWNTLSALCETTTRYVTKSIGIKDTSLIRASFAGEIPPEYKKGRYIAETVRRGAASFLNKPSCQIVHISGHGAHYLEEPDEEGILNKDRLLSQGIQIDFLAYNPSFTRRRWGVDPFSSGLEVLCKLGPKAVDILKYFAQQVNKRETSSLKRRVELKEKTIPGRKYYNCKIIEKGTELTL